jgi:vacuolar protein sorting-associated protein 13A/C
MFEKAFSYLLSNFLSEFIEEDCWNEHVSLAVWDGYVLLEGLVLKPKLFDYLKVPLSLTHGSIGRLEIRIPWTNLGYEPVEVVIDKIFLLVEPRYEWDEKTSRARQQASKQAKLAAAEIFATRRLLADSRGGYGDFARKWLLESLVHKLVDNVQIHIREVHVRLEDRMSCPTDFSVGVTLESLHVLSKTKEEVKKEESTMGRLKSLFRPTMSLKGPSAFHKVIQLNQFAVYWNPLVPGSVGLHECIGAPTASICCDMSSLRLV